MSQISLGFPCENSAPSSMGTGNCESLTVWTRPPILSRASRIVTCTPDDASLFAAASPATPAPMTITDCMTNSPPVVRRDIMAAVKILLALLLLAATLSGCGGNTPTMQSGSGASSGQAANAKAPDETAALDAIAKI